MIPLYIFLFITALYVTAAYELLATMSKHPKDKKPAEWPGKGGK